MPSSFLWGAPRTKKVLLAVLFFTLLLSCLYCSHDLNKFSESKARLEVSYNPYSAVNWATWKRCLSQHHDHVIYDEQKIRDYDEAGYEALALLHYSGVRSLAYTMRERIWPLTKFLSQYNSDAAFLNTTQNLKIFIPSMEEVGVHHMTSPFLVQYVERWEQKFDRSKEAKHYISEQELIDKITSRGGFPIIAHPTKKFSFYRKLQNFDALEIYNASFLFDYITEKRSQDYNQHFVAVWDDLLAFKSSRLFGYAVNDWSGPVKKERKETHPRIYDSGKTLVMLEEYTLEHYRASLQTGAFFSLKDLGVKKGLLPKVVSIAVRDSNIDIEVEDGVVSWIFRGDVIQAGPTFDLSALPQNLNYIRAEISNSRGTIYAQPFSLTAALYDKKQ